MSARTFADSLDADLDAFFNANEFGVEVFFKRSDESSQASVMGVASAEEGVVKQESPGETIGYQRHVVTRFESTYQPAATDVVTIAETEYAVVGITRQFGSAWRVDLYRPVLVEQARPDYRRAR